MDSFGTWGAGRAPLGTKEQEDGPLWAPLGTKEQEDGPLWAPSGTNEQEEGSPLGSFGN